MYIYVCVLCARLPQVITQRMPEAVVRGERNASVKQLRLRLASVKSIQRITKVCILECKKHPARFVNWKPKMIRIFLADHEDGCRR
jgi:hypothetical protein